MALASAISMPLVRAAYCVFSVRISMWPDSLRRMAASRCGEVYGMARWVSSRTLAKLWLSARDGTARGLADVIERGQYLQGLQIAGHGRAAATEHGDRGRAAGRRACKKILGSAHVPSVGMPEGAELWPGSRFGRHREMAGTIWAVRRKKR